MHTFFRFPFSIPGSHLGYHTTCSCHVAIPPLGCASFSLFLAGSGCNDGFWGDLWSGHSKWLLSCSLFIPCLTSACFNYTLGTYQIFLTFLPQAPSSDFSYQRDCERCAHLLASLVNNEPPWYYFLITGNLLLPPAAMALPLCPLHVAGCLSYL